MGVNRSQAALLLTLVVLAGALAVLFIGQQPSQAGESTQPSVHDFWSAVEEVKRNSFSVRVVESCSGNRTVVDKSDSRFRELLQRLSNSTHVKVTPKTKIIVEDGQTTTTTITIPYVWGYVLTFKLEDGSKIWFNCATENVWFETDQAIYQASIDPAIYVVLDEIVGEIGFSQVEPWISVKEFEVTEELFCPGPLGYSISTSVTNPGETVGVHFYAWKQDRVDLPGPVEFKLIQIDEEGNPVTVVDQETSKIKTVGSGGVVWEANVLDVAPAYYKFGVIIRDENGGVFGKLVSTLYVPRQELNAKLSLNKKEFRSGETLELFILNEGPTTLFFGMYYAIEHLEDGVWREAPWLYPNAWYDIGYLLQPGKAYNQSVELFPVLAGAYRISKEVRGEGTNISTTLSETFIVLEGTADEELPRAYFPEEVWDEIRRLCEENVSGGLEKEYVIDRLREIVGRAIQQVDPEGRIFVGCGYEFSGVKKFAAYVRHATKGFVDRWPKECHGVPIEIKVVFWALDEANRTP